MFLHQLNDACAVEIAQTLRVEVPPQKEPTRAQFMDKSLLVQPHDRVGRMADLLEYSNIAFPRYRFRDALLLKLKSMRPSRAAQRGERNVR